MQFKQACQNIQGLSKATLLASIHETSRNFLESIDNDNWQIISFNPTTRETCVRITTAGVVKTIGLTLI